MRLWAPELGRLTSGAVLLAGLVFVAFYTKDQITVEEMRTIIDSELAVGASSQDIEAFFERSGISYSYDTYNERYQSIIRDVSPYSFVDKAISIRIHTDSNKNFARAVVYSSYRSL